ncbi:hypothetical protein BDP27DRAFT_1426040 [Rhodocollybia butyracea]|uniref:DUF6534 domain-containing protein n=1 Tax=Rhodocollybia butyracea TaxID=206335 RepID=A0A9P5PJA4_9AGAR|nr:hypothetical protein BDP27DRAFT_1426040 [Rhodocollybia butyracea]
MASMNTTFGMLFDAVVVGAALYGAGCLQGYIYYRKYPEDPWYLKALVGFVLVCDTFQVGMLTACVYQYLVLDFANPDILGDVLNTLIIEIIFSNVIALAIQMLYCWRVWRLSKGSYLLVSILLGVVHNPVYSAAALKLTTWVELARLKNLSMSCNILAAASDIFISAAMVFYLQRLKSGYKKTNHLINRLIIFTFNAGIPVSICALWACISINVWPDTFIYMFFFLLQGRLYTNSLLVMLNSRKYARRGARRAETDATSYVMNSYHDPTRTRNSGLVDDLEFGNAKISQDDASAAIAIRIDTTKHTQSDRQSS